MIVKQLSILIGSMAASAEGCSFRLDLPWPLHRALADLFDRASARRLTAGMPPGLVIKGVPEAGRGVDGLEQVVLELVADGAFVPSPFDEGLLVVNPDVSRDCGAAYCARTFVSRT